MATGEAKAWSAVYDDEGNLFYYNSATEESVWEAPEEGFNPAEPAETAGDMPASGLVSEPVHDETAEVVNVHDWSAHYDDNGSLFYHNSVTDESAWEPPTESFNPPGEAPPVQSQPVAEEGAEPPVDSAQDETEISAVTVNDSDAEIARNESVNDPVAVAATARDAVMRYELETADAAAVGVTDHPDDTGQVSTDKIAASHKSAETISVSAKVDVSTAVDAVESEAVAATERTATGNATGERAEASNTDPQTYDWSAHYDEKGALFYYNSISEESAWEPPPEGFNPPEEQPDATTADPTESGKEEVAVDVTAVETSWVAYKDEEGREYYYNLDSGETQWDRPEHFKEAPVDADPAAAEADVWSDTKAPAVARGNETTEHAEQVGVVDDEAPPEPEPELMEVAVDPAVQRLHDAEAALAQPDSVLEPSCMTNVTEVVAANDGNPAKAIASLIENYHGQTAVCGLLSRWLVDLHQNKLGLLASKEAVKKHPNLAVTDTSNVDMIRDLAQNVINKMAKERFTKEAGDGILDLSKSEAVFLEELMDSSRWRKLLIDLSAAHKDSAVLLYCLRAISKRGHHREIARRINQSDHFAVFNAMLLSELSVIGCQAVAAGSDVAAAAGFAELVQDLTRACTATSFTYLYSVEMLRRLESTARADLASAVANGNDVSDGHERFRRAIRKWEALSQALESFMVDPTVSTSASGSSPMLRKRRMEVALTVSELHQRQRRRLVGASNNGVHHNGDSPVHSENLESALLSLLKRHSIGIKLEEAVLDKLLPLGLEMDTRGVGDLLIQHPLAVQALLGHLYKPGPTRVASPSTKNKCARLVALAMIAAEESAKAEARARGRTMLVGEDDVTPDEVALTRMIVQGSQYCEQVETMISFLVTSVPGNPGPQSAPSPGQKLCSLALQCPAVGLGVTMWAREFTLGKEYAASASFPTLSPSILSLVRLVALKHPFSRKDALQVALSFLRHANADVSYQKVNSIKECSLRLLIFLLVQGDVVPVLSSLLVRLQQVGSSELDASLIRYFVGGVLEVVQQPVSPVFVRTFGSLLNAPKVVDAVRSSYFAEASRNRLVALLRGFKGVRSRAGLPAGNLDESLVSTLLATYQVE